MILSVDPGATSGWARFADGYRASGHLRLESVKGIAAARDLMIGADVVVIESMGYAPRGPSRFDTGWALGVRAGTWATLARLADKPVAWVHPDKWQRACLYAGHRNPGRAMLKRLSQARATQIAGKVVGVDEADAICLGDYYVREQGRTT